MKKTKHFSDIASCVAYASQPLSNPETRRTSDRADGCYSRNWSNTKSFKEAAALALSGWPDGLAKVKPFADRLVGKLAGKVQRETYQPSVTGQFFDIGLVLSGEPECWLEETQTEQEQTRSGKVVTVSVAISASGAISSEYLEQRGSTVMALVQLLEQAGKAVRVIGILGCFHGSNDKHELDSTVVLKEASQPLNADQLAFWLVSPDALRRVAFAVREVLSDGEVIKDSMGAQKASQHVPDATIRVNRLDLANYQHGLSQQGFERQLIDWLTEAGVTLN